ncbi:tRNA (adenosine(37)-N6)-dimethylallyltransferase MiaA [Niabella terrae]
MQPILLVITGPTAVGKTHLAVELARRLQTVILSADSRQCYRELNIGVARPEPEELALVPHYFIASHTVTEPVHAAYYEQFGLALLEELFSKHSIVLLTGGTGLYIKALTEGLDPIPEIPPSIRQEITQQYEQEGIAWLREAIQNSDPLFATAGEMQNPRRMMRALEVVRATGTSIISYRNTGKATRPFRILRIALELPRLQLYERINLRVVQMVDAGLEAEVRRLEPLRNLHPLQTVGYQEFFTYFDGGCSREEAIAAIQQNTRHYAKRQLTWFKKQEGFDWLDAGDPDGALDQILRRLPR